MTSLLGLPIGPWLLTAGSIALIAVFGEIIRRQPASFTYTMGFGAVLWAAGNVLWLAGWPIFHVVWWWGGYLVLTIAGERLEIGPSDALPALGNACLRRVDRGLRRRGCSCSPSARGAI